MFHTQPITLYEPSVQLRNGGDTKCDRGRERANLGILSSTKTHLVKWQNGDALKIYST